MGTFTVEICYNKQSKSIPANHFQPSTVGRLFGIEVDENLMLEDKAGNVLLCANDGRDAFEGDFNPKASYTVVGKLTQEKQHEVKIHDSLVTIYQERDTVTVKFFGNAVNSIISKQNAIATYGSLVKPLPKIPVILDVIAVVAGTIIDGSLLPDEPGEYASFRKNHPNLPYPESLSRSLCEVKNRLSSVFRELRNDMHNISLQLHEYPDLFDGLFTSCLIIDQQKSNSRRDHFVNEILNYSNGCKEISARSQNNIEVAMKMIDDLNGAIISKKSERDELKKKADHESAIVNEQKQSTTKLIGERRNRLEKSDNRLKAVDAKIVEGTKAFTDIEGITDLATEKITEKKSGLGTFFPRKKKTDTYKPEMASELLTQRKELLMADKKNREVLFKDHQELLKSVKQDEEALIDYAKRIACIKIACEGHEAAIACLNDATRLLGDIKEVWQNVQTFADNIAIHMNSAHENKGKTLQMLQQSGINLTDATERRQVMMLAIDMCSIASCAENLAHLCYTVADRHVLNKLNAAKRDTSYTATAAKEMLTGLPKVLMEVMFDTENEIAVVVQKQSVELTERMQALMASVYNNVAALAIEDSKPCRREE